MAALFRELGRGNLAQLAAGGTSSSGLARRLHFGLASGQSQLHGSGLRPGEDGDPRWQQIADSRGFAYDDAA